MGFAVGMKPGFIGAWAPEGSSMILPVEKELILTSFFWARASWFFHLDELQIVSGSPLEIQEFGAGRYDPGEKEL